MKGQQNNSNLIDATPLAEPTNPWLFGAAVLQQMMPRVPVAAKKELQHRVRWLKHLGEQIKTGHNNPVLLMALSSAALDGEVRKWMLECLHQVDRVTRVAQGLPPEPEPVAVIEPEPEPEVEEGPPMPPPQA